MTREEAIVNLEKLIALFHTESEQSKMVDYSKIIETLEFAAAALRPVSRERVEKAWRGEWTPGDSICSVCEKNKFDGLDADIWADWMPSFCPNCGAPMTDEAVQMVMKRLKEMYENQ